MAEGGESRSTIGFKTIQLFKDDTLGIGSYGAVCKAKCDDLACAAKILHRTLVDPVAHQQVPRQREHRLPLRRFEQECEFMSTMRHPNIVQYLGIYQDTDTGLPVLLMELMDGSLTHFVESSTQPIPYHIQVNICHDIALALSFLHSNDIVHRDLSSNNVLLRGNILAKVTDFGMARLGDQNPRVTHLTFTMCPGTDVFMPPEAVRERPVYSEKIDCFSFGVITLQMLARKFPKPGDRRKEIEITQPGIPRGTVAEIRVPEIERRQEHIAEVDPNHILLQVTLDCLKDRAVERPSAQQLCERLAALKESQDFSESVQVTERSRSVDSEVELSTLREQHIAQVQNLQDIIQSQVSCLEERDQEITRQRNENIQLRNNNNRINQQISQFQRQIAELELQVKDPNTATKGAEKSSNRENIKMTWKEGEDAPVNMSTDYNAAIDSTNMYIRYAKKVYAYTMSSSTWFQLPDSPVSNCPSVFVNNLFTLIGGCRRFPVATNEVLSLVRDRHGWRWDTIFPPMPTKRIYLTALCTGTSLIVIGGMGSDGKEVKTVEIMDTESCQWSMAADLPQQIWYPPSAVCGDQIYIMSLSYAPKSMYTCSVSALLQSCGSRSNAGVWNRVAAPPVTSTTCVSIQGRLLTIGGKDSNGKSSAAVYMYYPTTDSWAVISHMATPRCNCYAAVLPNNQLMVVGGWTGSGDTDSVEMASVE